MPLIWMEVDHHLSAPKPQRWFLLDALRVMAQNHPQGRKARLRQSRQLTIDQTPAIELQQALGAVPHALTCASRQHDGTHARQSHGLIKGRGQICLFQGRTGMGVVACLIKAIG